MKKARKKLDVQKKKQVVCKKKFPEKNKHFPEEGHQISPGSNWIWVKIQ